MTSEDYREKLRDPRWQKKRLQVFDRDKWKCAACLDDSSTLSAHHLVYTAADPWDEPIEHLETLCDYCHNRREWFNEFWGRSLISSASCFVFDCLYRPAFSGDINLRGHFPAEKLRKIVDAAQHERLEMERGKEMISAGPLKPIPLGHENGQE